MTNKGIVVIQKLSSAGKIAIAPTLGCGSEVIALQAQVKVNAAMVMTESLEGPAM